jgi:hypothetical protein
LTNVSKSFRPSHLSLVWNTWDYGSALAHHGPTELRLTIARSICSEVLRF